MAAKKKPDAVPGDLSIRFVLPRRDLLSCIDRVRGVADAKSTMPILANVLLVAKDGRVTAHATNLTIANEAHAPAEIVRGGSTTLPAKDLAERVKAMPEGSVAIDVTDASTARIQAVGSKREFRLRGMPGDDFPAHLDVPVTGEKSTMKTADFLAAVRAGGYAISQDDTRPHLASALVDVTEGRLRIVTTDGHRLALADVATECAGTWQALVPRRALAELVALAKSGPGVDFTVGAGSIRAAVGDVTVTARLADAQFPPYDQVIPKGTQATTAIVSRAALLDVLRAVSVAASERTGQAKLVIGDGAIVISAESPDTGTAVDELEATTDGKPITVGVCGRYLIEALTALDADEVTIGMCGELDPVMVLPVGGAKVVGVVMPVRL